MGVTDVLGNDTFERIRSTAVIGAVIAFLLWVRSSFLAFVTTIGVLFTVTGLFVANGVLAGMLVILGVSSFVYAVLGFLILRFIGYN